MITSASDFLLQLKMHEESMLSKQDITHPPTIGSMYEGLSRHLIGRALPSNVELRLVDGFIRGIDGELSSQIDCMVVVGEGKEIPHTKSAVWDIGNVLAVFEIKKNLYANELSETYPKLQKIISMFVDFGARDGEKPIATSANAFSMITGIYLRHSSDIEKLPEELFHIFNTIFIEQFAPLRIVFGYDGFASEFSLREGFLKYFEATSLPKDNLGIRSLPNQIICRQNSLVKSAGHPYCSQMMEGAWPIIMSSCDNPLKILLELLWTKISYRFRLNMPPDDSLAEETFSLLLSAKYGKIGDISGWKFASYKIAAEELKSKGTREWQPCFVTEPISTILLVLGQTGSINLSDAFYIEHVQKHGKNEDEVLKEIVDIGFGAVRDGVVYPIQTFASVFLPDGRAAVAFEQDKLELWVSKFMNERKKSNGDSPKGRNSQ